MNVADKMRAQAQGFQQDLLGQPCMIYPSVIVLDYNDVTAAAMHLSKEERITYEAARSRIVRGQLHAYGLPVVVAGLHIYHNDLRVADVTVH